MSIGGRDTNFQHGTFGTPSVLVDYTTNIMSLDMPLTADEADATAYGGGYRSYESTFKSGTIPAEYYYTTAMYDVLFAIYDGDVAVDFQLGPTGTGSGAVKITGSITITSLGLPMPVGDVIKIPVTWRITGPVVPSHF
jgi:hypothetical protein